MLRDVWTSNFWNADIEADVLFKQWGSESALSSCGFVLRNVYIEIIL